MSETDLPDAYHHAAVSVRQAKSFAVGKAISSKHFVARGAAYQRMIERRTAAGIVPIEPASVRVAWRSLAMGDLNAVDIAQQVHYEVLVDAGCMKAENILV